MPKIAPNSPLYNQFRQDFPAQAGEGITSDLNYSDTIVPIVDMTDAAGEGSLPQNLQTAVDFGTTMEVTNTPTAAKGIINTPGFWKCSIYAAISASTSNSLVRYFILNGITAKDFFRIDSINIGSTDPELSITQNLVVFLRAGDVLVCNTVNTSTRTNIAYRQIATVNGELINPLGFSFT